MKLNIVMAAYNNRELTEGTWKSVNENTNMPFRFIIVNGGSTDDTKQWLDDSKIDYINMETNGGCGINRNVGMRSIDDDCEYVILIDNDIKATPNWCSYLIDFMENHKEFGVAGPSTNFAGNPQKIEDMPELKTEEEIYNFAVKRREEYKGQLRVVPHHWPVIGFCMIIRRAVIDKIGIFDEKYKLYGCEDNDYCNRVEDAGWQLAYIKDIYVHHWGSNTLRELGADGSKQWNENRKLFIDQWES